MIRLIIINGLLGIGMGAFLAILGYPVSTWQFWVGFGLFLAAIINSLCYDPTS